MTHDDIVASIKKLKYQISILGETVDRRNNPVEALIIEKDWGSEELDKVHDIFESWDEKLEQGLPLHKGEFENDFKAQLNIGYQGIKSIILAFHRNDQWVRVCEAYVESHGEAPPLEFFSIKRKLPR